VLVVSSDLGGEAFEFGLGLRRGEIGDRDIADIRHSRRQIIPLL
jgi:hypothetical protein